MERTLIHRNIPKPTVFELRSLLLLFILLILFSCQQEAKVGVDIYDHTEDVPVSKHLQAVILNPSGSSEIMYYDSSSQSVLPKKYAEGTRQMDFLAFPGNFGHMIGPDRNMSDFHAFIPSEAMLPGQIVEVKAVGALLLEKAGIPMTVVICVPIEDKYEAPEIEDFVDLMTTYDAVKYQIQHWFANYLGQSRVKVLGWEDEKYALRLLQKNEKKD